MSMSPEIAKLNDDAIYELLRCDTEDELEAFRQKWLSATGLFKKAYYRAEFIEGAWYRRREKSRAIAASV